MTKIGILSDTHLKGNDAFFEQSILRHFVDVDFIIHAGDMVTLDALNIFTVMGKKVIAVCGNMDNMNVQHSFPLSRTIEIEDVSIGIIHGWGAPEGIRGRIRDSFNKVDAIVYGHTHVRFAGMEKGIFFFNPGSPTDSRFTSPRSVGIMTVDKYSIEGEHIEL